jgi:hypothetical protein
MDFLPQTLSSFLEMSRPILLGSDLGYVYA